MSKSDFDHKGRVIVTYGRSLIALMIAQSLGGRGIDVIGCDSVEMTVLNFSKFVSDFEIYTSPEKDEEAFISDMLDIIKKHKPEGTEDYVLIPSFTEGVLLARHRDKFDGLIEIAYPSIDAVERVHPKDNLSETAMDLNVSAPQTWFPAAESDLDDIEKQISFPVFIKPPDEVGGRGIKKIDSVDELRRAFKVLQSEYQGQRILIQEACEGSDYCYCGLFNNGELVNSMVYQNIQKFPNEAGPGVVRETVDATKFDDLVLPLTRAVKWHGVIEIDFMWDGTDAYTPQMIEVNPRFWAGLDHSIKSGIDFPYMLYKLFTKGMVSEKDGADDQAEIGQKTGLPGLSLMAGIESLFTESLNFDDLEKQWPDIKQKIDDKNFKAVFGQLKELLRGSVTVAEAFDVFKTMRQQAKQAHRISYAEDDPLIGLGALFVLAYLARNGKLPPEILR